MRRFELVEGTSSKFWEVGVEGNMLTTRWGRIGTAGQSKSKACADATAATRELDKLVAEKTAKGYQEAGGVVRPPIPDEVKALAQLANKAKTAGEPMTRVYVMTSVDGPVAAAAAVTRAGGPPSGLTAATRPKYGDAFMHHLWTIDLDEVPELRRFAKLAGARAAALFIHDARENECFEPAAGRGATAIVAISDAQLATGAWSDAAVDDPASRGLAVFPIDVPARVFDDTIDFFELEESDRARDKHLAELHMELMSASYLNGAPIYFQGDDHKGEFLGQFSEAIVDVNLGDAGTMYVFSDLAFWACH